MMQGANKHVILPVFIGAAVLLISTTLLVIGARSPDTHANLDLGFDTRYFRTDQSLVGAPAPFLGGELVAHPANDLVEHGRRLFVTNGCAACHGLDGRGAVVGPSIVKVKAGKLRAKTLAGPGGMPAYAPEALSDDDLAAIATYLGSTGESAGSAPAAIPPSEKTAPHPTVSASNPAAVKAENGGLTGSALYQVSCAVCHGVDRAGKKFDQDGQTIDVPTLAWDELSKMYQTQPGRGTVPEQVGLAITKGQDEEGEDMGQLMPRWTSLSQAQVDSLIQYLQTASTASKILPAGLNLKGEQLYQAACTACHGQDRAGQKIEQDGQMIEIPTLTWDELSKMYQTQPGRGTVAEQVAQAITKGQNEEGEDLAELMPRWSSLTKEQVESLIQYLQTATR